MNLSRKFMMAVLASAVSVSVASAAEDVVVVYDASGSMWGQIDDTSKIEIAREVLSSLVQGWPTETRLGLVAYGHRSQGDCNDIETLIEPGPVDKPRFIEVVHGIRPKGKTPISAAVRHAAEALSYRDSPATIVLISDGVETCNADPCALAAELAQQGVKFTAHVVGFDLEDDAHAGLACIAENTGGMFVPARDAAGLRDALMQVQHAMTEEPVKVEPEPEKLPDAEIGLQAPSEVMTGARFAVSWSDIVQPEDYVTIVSAGAKEGTYGRYIRVRDRSEGELVAPAEPGVYEVRYVAREGDRTLGSATVEVVEAELAIAAPTSVTTGAKFMVSWPAGIHPEDYITIVPLGADEGSYGHYIRVRDRSEGELVAPAEPGLYEVRYVLREGGRTMASASIEVVEAQLTVTAPSQVVTGAPFDVSWSSSVHPEDYVTIVTASAKEGSHGHYIRVRDKSEGILVAPSDPGIYEVRYVLREGERTMASALVEVIQAEVSLTGPERVRAATEIQVTWSESIHPNDYITIVPAGAKEGSHSGYIYVRDRRQGDLKAPEEPGIYEIRYVLNEGSRTLAHQELEVLAADAPLDEGAGLEAPAEARIGEMSTIRWSGGSADRDQRIALARPDQPDFSWMTVLPANAEKTLELRMPDHAGTYEIRFLDVADRKVLGRALVKVGN